MVLKAIDNQKINDSKAYVDVISSFAPGDNISVQTDQGTYHVTLSKNPNNESRGFFGIQANKHFEMTNDSLGSLPWILFELIDLFQWVAMLNLGIGLFNSEQYYRPIVNALSAVLAMVIVFSIVAGFL